nr:spaetzle-processing enzyme [Drosophila takahashii]
MEGEVMYSDYVRPICLLIDEYMINVQEFKVTGWGATENDIFSKTLQETTVHNSSLHYCRDKYGLHTDESQICAGAHYSHTCVGDSGGPLSAKINYSGQTRVCQYGLVSYGSSRCIPFGTFEVYTHVGYHMEWIVNKVSEHERPPTEPPKVSSTSPSPQDLPVQRYQDRSVQCNRDPLTVLFACLFGLIKCG